MASPRNAASGARVTPEVESISSLLLHPLLQDPKFVAAVLAVFLSVVLFTCKSRFSFGETKLSRLWKLI